MNAMQILTAAMILKHGGNKGKDEMVAYLLQNGVTEQIDHDTLVAAEDAAYAYMNQEV